jgi:hypothetical protein
MRVLKQNPWLPSLGVLLAAVVVGGYARADVTTDEPGSIVIFPKVIFDGTRDTLIQLTNTSTSSAHVKCSYIDTSSGGFCSGTTPPAQQCSSDADCFANDNGTCIACAETDFNFSLTPLQPTVWRVSLGRNSGDQSEGFFIGAVPPRSRSCLTSGVACTVDTDCVSGTGPCVGGILGELKCFQTDIDGVPIGGNALKGEATIENLSNGQISEYNGIAIKAINTQTVAPTCVGGANNAKPCSTDTDCQPPSLPGGVCRISLLLDNTTEYNACPQQLLVNHYAEGATDPFTGAHVDSELTLVPCTEDLAGGTPTSTTVHFDAYNEFENLVTSKVVPFTCWLNISLGDSRLTPGFDAATFATPFGKTRVFPTSNTMSGVLGVLEEFHAVSGEPDGTAAINLHVVGARPGDTITLPAGQ